MRKLFLPFRRMRLFAFHWGISIEPRVPRAPHHPFVIPLSSLRPHQQLSAAIIISFPVATISRSQRSWRERAKFSLRMHGSVLQ
jgi:hypothetical protein